MDTGNRDRDRDREPQIKSFATAREWEQWLSENTRNTAGLWLRIAKKAAPVATVTYDEALDVALCCGWIDGQRKTFDADHFIQKFTPRRPRSLWSKRNIAKVAQLIESGRMRPEGLAEVEAARRDGRWEAAYDGQKDMVIPEDFLRAVQQSSKAATFFDTLNKSSRYSIAFRLHTARTPETRARRFAALLAQLESGEKPGS